MLLYGTEEPAQPSDQRYGPYVPQQFHRPSSGGIGQPSQVGTNNRRVNGGGGGGNFNKNGGGSGGWPGWFTGSPTANRPLQHQHINNNIPPPQFKKNFNNNNNNGGGGGVSPQFSSNNNNNIFGNFIRHLSRIVNSRRD
ncbi:unnamed protein product [Meloidogyne enterolobii]|uniref:Uncharacterized protein n=1 Tax=Meloidogyne enterolobii TaxID=390850 RepID=A0ACB1AES1_MELEN